MEMGPCLHFILGAMRPWKQQSSPRGTPFIKWWGEGPLKSIRNRDRDISLFYQFNNRCIDDFTEVHEGGDYGVRLEEGTAFRTRKILGQILDNWMTKWLLDIVSYWTQRERRRPDGEGHRALTGEDRMGPSRTRPERGPYGGSVFTAVTDKGNEQFLPFPWSAITHPKTRAKPIGRRGWWRRGEIALLRE